MSSYAPYSKPGTDMTGQVWGADGEIRGNSHPGYSWNPERDGLKKTDPRTPGPADRGGNHTKRGDKVDRLDHY
ncbi:hypothetical protein OEZ85_010418 [Tetradesmus obliquus]|uniref:Uncharacterized protein n=1 Tax=Tetradesmus obliquus TaxID=3088 RepID=A0ABY8TR07_TETOB|nr:hypothetical protein OEZ85_010418 [Tetradesmus obliquus]